MNDKSKYTEMFIEEAREQLEILNQALLDIENEGFDIEYLNAAYRIVHTIKGSAGVLGIDVIKDFAHSMEDLFDLLRENDESIGDEILDLLFRGSDIIETMINELSEKRKIKTKGLEVLELIRKKIDEISENTSEPSPDTGREIPEKFELSDEQKKKLMSAIKKGRSIYELDIPLKENIRFKEGRIYQLIKKLSSTGNVITSWPKASEIDDKITLVKILFATDSDQESLKISAVSITGITTVKIKDADMNLYIRDVSETKLNHTKEHETDIRQKSSGLLKTDTIRVKSNLLDKLLDLVGEIMISNIRVNKIAVDLKSKELKQALKNAERLIGDLQDTVLRIRMVPVEHIFNRFPRMVRDMAKEAGKEVKFDIMGYDIEIDRSLLDDTGDALVHLLRNAIDHGIEFEEDRMKQGKTPISNIKLSAFRDKSVIVITVEDDGRGIDIKRLKEKAASNGHFELEDLNNFDEQQVLQLAFLPGISTAKKVTEISGRGVGLDVAKSKIESLGGSIKVETKAGFGTKFTIKLPPSMSIISAMLVEINKENYAIPLENLNETTKLTGTDIHKFLENGMFRLREEILPLLNMHSEFGGDISNIKGDLPVIIVEKDDNRIGLVVSKLIGQQEIVVKNLNKNLNHSKYFSGATILGDGNVALILDVGSLL